MNISHPCYKLKIWKNGFLGITFEKLYFLIKFSQKGWHRKNFIIFNSLQENDEKLTLLIFYHL